MSKFECCTNNTGLDLNVPTQEENVIKVGQILTSRSLELLVSAAVFLPTQSV